MRMTKIQKEKLVELMEERYLSTVSFTTVSGNKNIKKTYNEIAEILNLYGPPRKTGLGWKSSFKYLKSRTKAKVGKIRKEQNKTGGGVSNIPTEITDIESKMIMMVGEENMNGIRGLDEPGVKGRSVVPLDLNQVKRRKVISTIRPNATISTDVLPPVIQPTINQNRKLPVTSTITSASLAATSVPPPGSSSVSVPTDVLPHVPKIIRNRKLPVTSTITSASLPVTSVPSPSPSPSSVSVPSSASFYGFEPFEVDAISHINPINVDHAENTEDVNDFAYVEHMNDSYGTNNVHVENIYETNADDGNENNVGIANNIGAINDDFAENLYENGNVNEINDEPENIEPILK